MKYYTTISQLPIYNWRMINETDDLRFLLQCKDPQSKTVTKEVLTELSETWQNIFDSFIDTFGISDVYREVISLRMEILTMRIEEAIDKRTDLRTFIEIKEWQLSKLTARLESNNMSFERVQTFVEKYMRFPINESRCSVAKYYNYLKLIEEQNGRGD